MKNIVSWIGSGITLVTAVMASDVAQLILLIVGVVSACVSLAYNIYCWVIKAKADGKIDKEEVDELVDIIGKGADDITDAVNDNKGGKDNG